MTQSTPILTWIQLNGLHLFLEFNSKGTTKAEILRNNNCPLYFLLLCMQSRNIFSYSTYIFFALERNRILRLVLKWLYVMRIPDVEIFTKVNAIDGEESPSSIWNALLRKSGDIFLTEFRNKWNLWFFVYSRLNTSTDFRRFVGWSVGWVRRVLWCSTKSWKWLNLLWFCFIFTTCLLCPEK